MVRLEQRSLGRVVVLRAAHKPVHTPAALEEARAALQIPVRSSLGLVAEDAAADTAAVVVGEEGREVGCNLYMKDQSAHSSTSAKCASASTYRLHSKPWRRMLRVA